MNGCVWNLSSSVSSCTSLIDRIALLKKSAISLDPSQYAALLHRCAHERALEEGKFVHWHIVASGCGLDRYLKNHLIFMYAKCGSLQSSLDLFQDLPNPNVFSWTAVLTAYARQGQFRGVVSTFRKMQLEGFRADEFVLSTVIAACSSLGALTEGIAIHRCVICGGYECGVVGNSLINLYGKCRKLDEAKSVFDAMMGKNTVSWNALIAAYVQNNICKEGIRVYHLMDLEGDSRPDNVTFVSVANACANLLDFVEGDQLHKRVIFNGFHKALAVANALVDMFGKCGRLDYVKQTFEGMARRDVFSWTSTISAYAQIGDRKEAMELYQRMDLEGIRPNDVTFVSVLFACSHSGLVDEAKDFFRSMVEDHRIAPTKEHYGCMIDLLGRAGRLADAKLLIRMSPFKHRSYEWITLLGACKIHGDSDLAFDAMQEALVKDPRVGSPYLLLLETRNQR